MESFIQAAQAAQSSRMNASFHSMPMTVLDHIVIVAHTLPQGLDYCEAMLGVRPPKGGEHARMGTHNHLLRLGDRTYLEVIAVNPAAPAPDRTRWFGMDSAIQRQRMAERPFLATFVTRTSDIGPIAAALPALGSVIDMERGDLRWKITVRDDGGLVEGGTVPTVIEWPQEVEPVTRMADLGCRLERLVACHPRPECLRKLWESIDLHDDRLTIEACQAGEAPFLAVCIDTPFGPRMLSGRI
jgi:hypothetical protein